VTFAELRISCATCSSVAAPHLQVRRTRGLTACFFMRKGWPQFEHSPTIIRVGSGAGWEDSLGMFGSAVACFEVKSFENQPIIQPAAGPTAPRAV